MVNAFRPLDQFKHYESIAHEIYKLNKLNAYKMRYRNQD